jgi:hypothetical protein
MDSSPCRILIDNTENLGKPSPVIRIIARMDIHATNVADQVTGKKLLTMNRDSQVIVPYKVRRSFVDIYGLDESLTIVFKKSVIAL